MKFILKSLIKYSSHSLIYMTLLTASFTAITVLINTFLTAQTLIIQITVLRELSFNHEESLVSLELLRVRDVISMSMSSLIPTAMLIILLCIVVLPFLQYLFSIGRCHEIGILRALGLSRAGAWRRLLIENIVVLSASLAATTLIVLFSYKRFALSLLSIDEIMLETLKEVFADINVPFSFNRSASLYTLGLAIVITIITAGLSNILISGNSPLKLIRRFK
jgi:hypothetical protein